ncbi:hypothetical protein V2G26_008488 [Clonostachys chloroleuca]
MLIWSNEQDSETRQAAQNLMGIRKTLGHYVSQRLGKHGKGWMSWSTFAADNSSTGICTQIKPSQGPDCKTITEHSPSAGLGAWQDACLVLSLKYYFFTLHAA